NVLGFVLKDVLGVILGSILGVYALEPEPDVRPKITALRCAVPSKSIEQSISEKVRDLIARRLFQYSDKLLEPTLPAARDSLITSLQRCQVHHTHIPKVQSDCSSAPAH